MNAERYRGASAKRPFATLMRAVRSFVIQLSRSVLHYVYVYQHILAKRTHFWSAALPLPWPTASIPLGRTGRKPQLGRAAEEAESGTVFPKGRALARAVPKIHVSNQEKDCPAVRPRHIMHGRRVGNVWATPRRAVREGV
jgi:hypothetical protein